MKAFLQFLQRAFKYFRNTKRVWRRPPRASLLIIDRGTASPLDEMFAHHNPHIMEIRGESVNMFALLRALPKIHLGAVAYLEAYIDFVKPKLILSRTDNNHTLWQLKRRPNVTYKVALIQNGWRPEHFGASTISNFHQAKSRVPEIDFAFVFGSAQCDKNLKYFCRNVVVNGSSKLNELRLINNKESSIDLLFISEYRTKDMRVNPTFYRVDESVLSYVAKFASKNKIKIEVAGVMEDDLGSFEELKWFGEHFSGLDWKFHRRNFDSSSYELVGLSKMVVTVDSTMGYECLAIGKKVAMLTCRKVERWSGYEEVFENMMRNQTESSNKNEAVDSIANRFGASFNFEDTGFFWTNIESTDEFERVLNNVFQASAAEFEIISRPFADQLMVHDYGNTKIRAYVEGVLTDSLETK
jgi:surface carbohydrate biosynthesis protein